MKEWRRTLKAWPKETAKIADPASLPSWVREAVLERTKDVEAVKLRRRSIALFGIVGIPFVILVDCLPSSDPTTWYLIALGLVSVPLAALLSKRSWQRVEANRRQRETERLEALGESTLASDFVGVDYAEGLWTYPGLERGVDQGVLRFDLDRLSFVGRHTRFEIPPNAI